MPEGRAPANEPNLEGDLQATLDTGVAHPARVYDYWLGGKDHFAVDREAAEQVIAANPAVLPGVRANRAFLGRAVRYLAGEAGIRQFLDLGTGLPTAQNTHQVAQSVAPDARIVYVDNDPMVLAHARALLTLRTRPDFERFFGGLEMVQPGIVPLPQWRGPGSEHPIPCYAGMGRKPARG